MLSVFTLRLQMESFRYLNATDISFIFLLLVKTRLPKGIHNRGGGFKYFVCYRSYGEMFTL